MSFNIFNNRPLMYFLIFLSVSLVVVVASNDVILKEGSVEVVSGDLVVDSIDLVVKATDNRVGIGNSTPDSRLQVNDGGNNSDVHVYNIFSGFGGWTAIGFLSSLGDSEYALAGDSDQTWLNAPANKPLRFMIGNVEGMRLDGDLDVGIGTAIPSAKLDVEGGASRGIVEIDGSSGGCLKIRDTDDSGWTYCTVLNGALSCSTTAC